MSSNPLFIDQPDGTALPSPELVERIRANPARYPTAAQDLADLSGKSIEEVEAILSNGTAQQAYANEGLLGAVRQSVRNDPIFGTVGDLYQGAFEAGAVLSDKLGYEDVGTSIRDAKASIDPKFESEQGVVENVSEAAGQYVPAIAAGATVTALTGGTGAVPIAAGVLTEAAVATATIEAEDSTFNTLQALVPGITPDALVVTDMDDDWTAAAKMFAGEAITGGALTLAGKAVSPLLTAISRRAPAEELEPLLKEAQEAIDGTPMTTAQVKQVTAEAAERRFTQAVAVAEHRPGAALDAVSANERKAFHEDVFGGFHRLAERADEVNTGAAVRFSVEQKPMLAKYVDDVLEAVAARNYDQAAEMLRKGVRIGGNRVEDNHIAVLEQSLLRAVQSKVEANYGQIVKAIRTDPSLRTKGVWKQLSDEYLDAKAKIGELDRLQGSSAAYQFEPRRLCRRPFGLSYAAMAGTSSMA